MFGSARILARPSCRRASITPKKALPALPMLEHDGLVAAGGERAARKRGDQAAGMEANEVAAGHLGKVESQPAQLGPRHLHHLHVQQHLLHAAYVIRLMTFG